MHLIEVPDNTSKNQELIRQIEYEQIGFWDFCL